MRRVAGSVYICRALGALACLMLLGCTSAHAPSDATPGAPSDARPDASSDATPDASWLDPGWSYRRTVTISNPSGSPLTDYQVAIELGATFSFDRALPDGSDVRVTAEDGTTLLPFWIEQWDASSRHATVWIKLPELPVAGAIVLLHYGNPRPTVPGPATREVPPTGPFVRARGNPILPQGDPGGGAGLLAENLVYDAKTKHWWLVFANYRDPGVGLVWSDNPTDATAWHWFGNIVTSPNGGSFAPHLLSYQGTWYLFYSDWSGSFEGTHEIVLSTATSITGPYTTPVPILRPSEAWEAWRVDEPFVFQREDGKWMLLYMADSGGYVEQVGYATADAVSGPYTKFAGNPCIPFGAAGSYDAGTVADPWVVYFQGVYYIGYAASSTTSSPWQAAYATTTDWQTFTKRGLVLPLAPSGWDAANSFRGAVTRIDDTWVYSYTGDSYQMGIATQPAVVTPPTPVNNPEAVFDFFDDFAAAEVNATKWSSWIAQGSGGTLGLDRGILTLSAPGGTNGIGLVGTRDCGPGQLLELFARRPDADGSSHTAAEVGLGRGFADSLRILDYDDPAHLELNTTASGVGGDVFAPLSTALDATAFHLHRIFWASAAEVRFAVDADPWQSVKVHVPTVPLPPFLLALAHPAPSRLMVDWVRVRKWTGDTPVVTVGAEESRAAAGDAG